MRVIFDAGPQRWKIWFVVLICVLCAALFVFAGGHLFVNYGLQPAEGGVLKPLADRLFWLGVFALPGLAIIAALVLYLRCYVTRVELDDEARAYRVALAGPGRTLAFTHEEITGVGYNDGISHAGGISVNAPWYTVRLRGRRFGLIIDMQGDFLDQRAVDRLVEGEPIAQAAPRPQVRKPLEKKRRR